MVSPYGSGPVPWSKKPVTPKKDRLLRFEIAMKESASQGDGEEDAIGHLVLAVGETYAVLLQIQFPHAQDPLAAVTVLSKHTTLSKPSDIHLLRQNYCIEGIEHLYPFFLCEATAGNDSTPSGVQIYQLGGMRTVAMSRVSSATMGSSASVPEPADKSSQQAQASTSSNPFKRFFRLFSKDNAAGGGGGGSNNASFTSSGNLSAKELFLEEPHPLFQQKLMQGFVQAMLGLESGSDTKIKACALDSRLRGVLVWIRAGTGDAVFFAQDNIIPVLSQRTKGHN